MIPIVNGCGTRAVVEEEEQTAMFALTDSGPDIDIILIVGLGMLLLLAAVILFCLEYVADLCGSRRHGSWPPRR